MARHKQIAILDAGSQFCGQIDRVVHELDIDCDILPLATPLSNLEKYKALIISGGPDSVNEPGSKDCDPAVFNSGKPILGICYGMQLIAKHLGGSVGDSGLREDGKTQTTFSDNPLFKDIDSEQQVWMSHGDSVNKLPEGFEIIGKHGDFVSAIANDETKIYGLQFHPEVHNTPKGKDILRNFIFNIAKLTPDFKAEDRLRTVQEEIKNIIGDKDVIMYLSGGVDSTVMAVLIAKTIEDPHKIHAYHIDNGFMRADESKAVEKVLHDLGVDVKIINAESAFLNSTTIIDGTPTKKLCEVTDPQQKRKIIGDCFATIREEIIKDKELPLDTVLAQGTLRPDIIESGSDMAGTGLDTIKTHHNDTDGIRKLRKQALVVEPLKFLYKDQVRVLGRDLGLPDSIVDRHPFPGPGLAIRIICSDGTVKNKSKISEANAQLQNILEGSNIEGDVLPVQTVGVQGDGRTYSLLAVIRCDNPDWSELAEYTRKITNAKIGINRVAYGFVNKPPIADPVETFLNSQTTTELKEADKIVRDIINKDGSKLGISQMPVILVPISFDQPGQRSIAIRPFITPDFMTGEAGLPGIGMPKETIDNCVSQLLELDNVSQVLLDLTSKPPGTTEWE